MYASIDTKYLEKNKQKANKLAKEEIGDEDGKDTLMFPNLVDDVDNFDFEEGHIVLGLSNDLGYFSIEYDLTDDEMFQIIEHMKSKGQKIKRLINLCGE